MAWPAASKFGAGFWPDDGSATSPKWTAAVVANDTTNALNDTGVGMLFVMLIEIAESDH